MNGSVERSQVIDTQIQRGTVDRMDGWMDRQMDGGGETVVFEGDKNNNQHLSMNIQVDGKQD